jgi:hypothetical protein
MDLLIVHFLERPIAPQDLGDLADHEAQVAEIEWDILKTQDRRRRVLVALDRVLRDREEWQGHAPLDPALDFQQLDVQIDGRLQLRQLRPDGP